MEYNDLIYRMVTDCQIRGHAHRNRFSKYRNLHVNIGLPSAIVATIAGSLVTIGVNIPTTTQNLSWLEILALATSWLVAALTSANTFLRPYETSQGHREKAGAYDVLLGKIGRVKAFEDRDNLESKLEEIDSKIEELEISEPFLSDKRISESKKQLEKEGV